MHMFPVVFFGDSITAGWGVPPEQGWVDMLSSRLLVERPELSLALHNAGVPGNTSRDGFSRLQRDVLSRGPRLVSVQFGLNDCFPAGYAPSGTAQVPLAAYEEAMRNIVARCQDVGARVLLLTSHPTRLDDESFSGYAAACARYNETVRALAQTHQTALCDIEASWNALAESEVRQFLALDGVHLSVAGNASYAALVAASVEPLLAG